MPNDNWKLQILKKNGTRHKFKLSTWWLKSRSKWRLLEKRVHTLISVGPKGQEKFIERSRANEPQCKTDCDESGWDLHYPLPPHPLIPAIRQACHIVRHTPYWTRIHTTVPAIAASALTHFYISQLYLPWLRSKHSRLLEFLKNGKRSLCCLRNCLNFNTFI